MQVQGRVMYLLSFAFTSALRSTRNWQTSIWPSAEDQCSGLCPLREEKVKKLKQIIRPSFQMRVYGAVVVHVILCVYVGIMLDEKFANIEVASFSSKNQRSSVPRRQRENE